MATPPTYPADPPPEAPPPTEFVDVVCLGCGCLCDDLAVRVQGGRVVGHRNACPLGEEWLASAGRQEDSPIAAVDGREATPDTALDRLAAILAAARRPVLYGLTRTTTEAVRAALAIADRLGALVLLDETEARRARVEAFQEAGKVTATLGEVRDRADVVVFWGGRPDAALPRFAQRYAVEPSSRFLLGGRADRTLLAVGGDSDQDVDLRIDVAADLEFELLAAIRCALRHPDEAGSMARRAGVDPDAFEAFLARLLAARYGAVVYRPGVADSATARAGWVAVSALVRQLSEGRRFALIETVQGGNAPGAVAAMTWQAGFAPAVDFRLGAPGPAEDTPSLGAVLRDGEADAVVVIGDRLPDDLPAGATARLAPIPIALIGADPTAWNGPTPRVALTSARTGLEVAGTVTRADGVALPLRPVRASRYPTDRSWLRRLGRRLGAVL